ncbi:MAG: histidine kinase [Gammaproteobacteria bacterium BRH_c0]|nr:MAG: histidine kinase [Gammaproteobacteria bacterium BRH_c0]
MMLSAEITLYPLQDDYLPVIVAFLERLQETATVKFQTFPTCTVLTGEYEQVLKTLGDMMRWSHDTHGKGVFVAKFLPGYEAI